MAIINPQTGQAFEENKNPFNNEVVDPTFANVTQEDYAGGVKANTERPPVPPTPPPAKNDATGYSLVKPDGYTPDKYADKYAPGGMHWEYGASGNRIAVNNTPGVDYSQYDSSYNRTDTTPGEAYAGVDGSNSSIDQYYKDLTAPIDEAAIRQNTINSFQDQIDALNRVYAEKKRVETIRGEGRLGSGAAVQARRGLLGSDFGAAQTEKVSQYNKGEQDSIDAQRSAEVANILGQARQEANNEINAKRQARQSGLPQYLEFLKGQDERKEKRVQTTIDNILYSEVEATDDLFASLAKELGVSKETVKGMYNKGKATRDKENAKEGFTLNPGDSRYDSSGNVIATAPNKPSDGAPNVQKIGEDLYQYDATKGVWNKVVTGTTPGGDKKIVKINGVDYEVDANGNYTTPVVPALVQQATETKTNALTSAKTLLEKFDAKKGTSAVGKSSVFPVLPGTEAANFKADFDSLKSLLSLDNVKLLKGQGAVSDAERALLEKASTKLSLAQTEPEFRQTLSELITGLSGPTSTSSQPVVSPKAAFDSLNTGSTYEDAVAQYGAEGVQKMIDAQAKTKPLSMGENGSAIYAKLASVSTIPDGSKGGQCGRFVNQQTGLGLGDSYQSKMAKMDKSIKEPAPGMAFVMPYGSTGHTGIILNVENGIATVKDSNYGLDEKVRTHKIPVSSMTGFAYPKPSHLTA